MDLERTSFMPHIIIEHSEDFSVASIQSLGKEIQHSMAQTGHFDSDQFKIRNLAFETYFVGKHSASSSSFIHVTVKILAGRSLEIRQEAAKKALELVKVKAENLGNDLSQLTDISVDIVEMDRETYQKLRIAA